MAIILPYNGVYPKIAKSAFIAENAVIIGDVTIGENTSIWYNCIVRGDVNCITIAEGTNIQDGTIIHVHRNNGPTHIGSYVTVGHMVLLHACTVEDYAFIGMGAKVIDYSTVKSYAMVGAASLIAPNKVVPTHELWGGVPGKKMRMMTTAEIDHVSVSANNYIKLAREYNGAFSNS